MDVSFYNTDLHNKIVPTYVNYFKISYNLQLQRTLKPRPLKI